jgi:hypothetical protein
MAKRQNVIAIPPRPSPVISPEAIPPLPGEDHPVRPILHRLDERFKLVMHLTEVITDPMVQNHAFVDAFALVHDHLPELRLLLRETANVLARAPLADDSQLVLVKTFLEETIGLEKAIAGYLDEVNEKAKEELVGAVT